MAMNFWVFWGKGEERARIKEEVMLTGEVLVYKVDLHGSENGACSGADVLGNVSLCSFSLELGLSGAISQEAYSQYDEKEYLSLEVCL